MKIRNNGQPTATYHDFTETVLADGDALRMTVDVATDTPIAQKAALRLGLGFASPVITGDVANFNVHLSGYYMTIPSAGSPGDPQFVWVSPGLGAGTSNFFGSSTKEIGRPKLDNAVSASSTMKTWVIEVKRSGDTLIFSGSLDGTAFGTTVTASAPNVIAGFKFNELGLAHTAGGGATATYDNLKVELVSLSSSCTLIGIAGANGTVTPASTNVAAGGDAVFTITADPYYRINTVTTNGGYSGVALDNLSTSYIYTWTNVQSAGTLAATFTRQVTTNAPSVTPYEWLSQYGLTNYDADAVADQDSDGLLTWEEYITGTVPTNAASVLKASQTTRDVVTWDPVTGRVYLVYWSTNLVNGFTTLVGDIVHPQGSYTNAAPDSRVNHYKVGAVLASSVSASTPVDLSSLPAGVGRVDVYLLLGQSNMKGRGAIPAVQTGNPLTVNMNMADNQWYVAHHPLHKAGVPDLIDGSDNAGVGPGLDFARGVLSRTNGVRIALVPCAVGGSWISLWQPGQPFYTNAIYRARKALADAPPGTARIKGVLWLQGESDATESRYADYESKLSTLVRSLRADLNEPDLPFIACTIGTFINNTNSFPRVTEINNTLLSLPLRESHTACVDARDLTGHIGDNLHYNTDSQIIIGGRYANKYTP